MGSPLGTLTLIVRVFTSSDIVSSLEVAIQCINPDQEAFGMLEQSLPVSRASHRKIICHELNSKFNFPYSIRFSKKFKKIKKSQDPGPETGGG